MADTIEQIRARAAARARAVRVSDASDFVDPEQAAIEHDYNRWLTKYYPKAVSRPMGFFHKEFWDWAWKIELDEPHPDYDAFFGIWSRGYGKTTSGNLAIASLGARQKRRYCWLLSRTQEQANSKLLTVRLAISRMGSDYLRDYRHMAAARTERGVSLGFNTTRLICGYGDSVEFIVEAIGLDRAVRGSNIEFQRPDLIMPDDIDNLHDSLHVVEKNIETLTKSILFAGEQRSLVVLGFQNLIHRDSIFSQVADNRAEFLMNRLVSGPYPALEGDVKYEKRETPKGQRFFITSGTPVWPEGFGIEECEKILNSQGPDAFETECQHNVTRAHEDTIFKEFDPVFHCITVSEFMRFFAGRKALLRKLGRLDINSAGFTADGMASRLILPRGESAMAQDWGNNRKHPVATRWMWRPGEAVPLSDSVFFIREQCWPTFPTPKGVDPRAHPTYGQLHKAIVEVEKELGLSSKWNSDEDCIAFRLFSHERPEGGLAYWKDFGEPHLTFYQVDTKEAAEGILHLQELQHVDYDHFHPFRIDPRTVDDVDFHWCELCGWEHRGWHLQGRPRAFYLVADGQGEIDVDKFGKLVCAPYKDELGQARTRFEYPRHRSRETADGEEKRAPKKDDDIIDTDKALAGHFYRMIKPLSQQERIDLKYREIYEGLQAGTYPDSQAREIALMSNHIRYEEEVWGAKKEGASWLTELDGWEDS